MAHKLTFEKKLLKCSISWIGFPNSAGFSRGCTLILIGLKLGGSFLGLSILSIYLCRKIFEQGLKVMWRSNHDGTTGRLHSPATRFGKLSEFSNFDTELQILRCRLTSVDISNFRTNDAINKDLRIRRHLLKF